MSLLISAGAIPLPPHLIFTQVLDDTDPEERKTGIGLGLKLMERCDEVRIYLKNGQKSAGMVEEEKHAHKLGKKIVFIDWNGGPV